MAWTVGELVHDLLELGQGAAGRTAVVGGRWGLSHPRTQRAECLSHRANFRAIRPTLPQAILCDARRNEGPQSSCGAESEQPGRERSARDSLSCDQRSPARVHDVCERDPTECERREHGRDQRPVREKERQAE